MSFRENPAPLMGCTNNEVIFPLRFVQRIANIKLTSRNSKILQSPAKMYKIEETNGTINSLNE